MKSRAGQRQREEEDWNSVHGNWGFGFCNWGLGFWARFHLSLLYQAQRVTNIYIYIFWQVNFLLTSFWPKNTWSWSSADVCLAVQHSTPLTTILLWISKIVVGNIPQRVMEIFCHMDAKAFSLKIVFANGEQQTTGSLLNFWYQDTQPTALLRPCFSQSWKAGDPTQQPWT